MGLVVDQSVTRTPRRRGRPPSERSRLAALSAAADILAECGYLRMTVDEVARRSGVSKATIYKHWPDGFHLAAQAFGDLATDLVPTISTGDALADLRDQFVRLAAFYASESGVIAKDLIAAAALRDDGTPLIRARFFGRRRDDTTALIDKGKQAGQVRTDIPTASIIDLVFGPIVFRLFNGEGPMPADVARTLAPIVINAIAAPSALERTPLLFTDADLRRTTHPRDSGGLR